MSNVTPVKLAWISGQFHIPEKNIGTSNRSWTRYGGAGESAYLPCRGSGCLTLGGDSKWEPASKCPELGALRERWCHTACLESCTRGSVKGCWRAQACQAAREPEILKVPAGYPLLWKTQLEIVQWWAAQNSSHPYQTSRRGQWEARALKSYRDGFVAFSSVCLSAGSLGAGWLSWKEIKQVFQPAWQAVKILPGFCQFCHTSPSIQAEISRKCCCFPVSIVRFQKLSWYLLGKNVDDFHSWELKGRTKGTGQWKMLFQNHFLNYLCFQNKTSTETNSAPLNTSIWKTWHIQMNKMSCSITTVLLMSVSII